MKNLQNLLPKELLATLKEGKQYITIKKYKIEESLPKQIQDKIVNKRRKSKRNIFQPSELEKNYYTKLAETEFSTKTELQNIQLQKLKSLITFVYREVPYYREVMSGRNLTPNDFNSLKDLAKLPILTKDDIRKQPEKFIPEFYSDSQISNLKKISTGGSTGTPMTFLFDEKMISIRKAHWWRWSKFAGVDLYNDKMIYIGSDAESKYRKAKNYKGIYNATRTRLSLSANAMSPAVVDRYIESMKSFNGDYIRGYASAVYLLAVGLNERKTVIPLKAILTSSDGLLPHYRDVIRKAFKCEVFDFYGQNEDVLTGTECETHNGFHINSESCIAETVDSTNNVIQDNGFLVGTHLENYSMPLIRYKVGDIGKLDLNWEKCQCGRSHQKIIELDGRDGEVISSPGGRKTACGSMSLPMKLMGDAIIKCQFVQEQEDVLIINLVPGNDWSERNKKKFFHKIREQVGDDLILDLRIMKDIPTRKNGKFQLIVSKL